MKKTIIERVMRVMRSDPKFKHIQMHVELEVKSTQTATTNYKFSVTSGQWDEPYISINPRFLMRLSDPQLQFVTNHEKAHHENGDSNKADLFSAGIFSSSIATATMSSLEPTIVGKIGLLYAVGTLAKNAMVRRCEFKADQDAVHGSVELCDAAITLFQGFASERAPSSSVSWWRKVMSKHPTIEERINQIERIKEQINSSSPKHMILGSGPG